MCVSGGKHADRRLSCCLLDVCEAHRWSALSHSAVKEHLRNEARLLQVLVETSGGAKYTAGDSLRMLQDLNLTQQARLSVKHQQRLSTRAVNACWHEYLARM